MIKSKVLKGTAIVDKEIGKIIGKIDDTIFMPRRKKIMGFIICCGKWIKSEKVLSIDCVDSIGKDAVMVSGNCKLIDMDENDEIKKAVDEKNKFIRLKVITDRGEEIGFIEDIIINEKTCSIEGYLITDGIIEDIINGKSIIPFSDHIIIGENAVIIESESANTILKNDISLKKLFENSKG